MKVVAPIAREYPGTGAMTISASLRGACFRSFYLFQGALQHSEHQLFELHDPSGGREEAIAFRRRRAVPRCPFHDSDLVAEDPFRTSKQPGRPRFTCGLWACGDE